MWCSQKNGRNEIWTYVPENFHPENALPEPLQRFADDARYFVGLVYERRMLDFRKETDFVPLKSEYLRNVMHAGHFAEIRNFLLDSDVLRTDGRYIEGKKAFGYRLGEDYRKVTHRRVELLDPRLRRRIIYQQLRQQEDFQPVHHHLLAQLRRVEIDRAEALVHIRGCYQEREDFQRASLMLDKIAFGDWFFHVDDFGRVHSNATNLKSSLRKRLLVDGEGLVELDIANSQPFFLGLLLKVHYLSTDSQSSTLPGSKTTPFGPFDHSSNSKRYNRCAFVAAPQTTTTPSQQPLRLKYHYSGGLFCQPDLTNYLSLVAAGGLYEYLFKLWGVDPADRGAVKEKLFAEVFFGKNRRHSEMQQRFADAFPTVFAAIQKLKAKDYRHLAHLLQRVESSFIVGVVAERFMHEAPKTFLATVHDSLLVKSADVQRTKRYLLEAFTPYGFVPTIRVKHAREGA